MNPRANTWALTVANSVKASIDKPAKSERTSKDLVAQFAALNPLSQTFDDRYEGPEIDIADPQTWRAWQEGTW